MRHTVRHSKRRLRREDMPESAWVDKTKDKHEWLMQCKKVSSSQRSTAE